MGQNQEYRIRNRILGVMVVWLVVVEVGRIVITGALFGKIRGSGGGYKYRVELAARGKGAARNVGPVHRNE